VAVVGGGPSGACAAHALAGAGVDVVLLERDTLPRYKVCGGGVVQRVHQFLPVDVAPAVERRCLAVELNLLPSAQHFVARRQQPVVSMTMRAQFDWLLVDGARRAGARVVYPCEVTDIDWRRDGVELHTPAGRLSARFVVAADGAAGHLARWGGWQDSRILAPALEYEVTVPPEVLERFGRRARFDIGAASNGYGWVFPKREHLSVGVGVFSSARRGRLILKQSLQRYLAAIGVTPLIAVQAHGYVIPLRPRKAPLSGKRMLLVGDSAGLADPLTGEGISNAVISGRLAGEALVAGGLHPERVMAHYQERIDGTVLRELRAARSLARLLYGVPGLAAPLFARYGARMTERVTDIFMGERSYVGEVGRRIDLMRTSLGV
jgi:geranylgeranyl reductase family protein